MKNRLQNYFDVARNADPLMTTAEVKKLTGSGKSYSVYKQNLKYIMMISTGIIALVSVLFYMQHPDEQPAIKTKGEQAANHLPQVTYRESTHHAAQDRTTVHEQISPATKTEHKTSLNEVDLNNDQRFVSFGTVSPVPEISVSSTNAANYFDEAGRLVLSYEELAALGIITNGNVLEYANVTDSAETLRWEGSDKKLWPYYKLSVEEHGSRRVDISGTNDDAVIINSKPFWAAAVTYEDGQPDLNITENIYGQGYDRSYFNALRPLLVPVSVKLKAKPGRWSHDLSVVFWFKPTGKFYNALHPSVADACIEKFGTRSEMQFRDSLEHYRNQVKILGNTKGFDAATVAVLQKNYVHLTKDELKERNIYSRKDGFYYSGLIETGKGVNWLRIKEQKNHTTISTGKFFRFKKPVKYKPVALTDRLLTRVHYLTLGEDGAYESNKDSLLASFKKHAHELLPVYADSASIMWFTKDPADSSKNTASAKQDEKTKQDETPYVFRKPFTQKENPLGSIPFDKSEVQDQQKRYVVAKPGQYRSLGIYIDNNGLIYQNWFLHEGKVLDQYVTRRNDGAVSLGIRDAKGSLRPYDNPFHLVAITGYNMESAFFFSKDSFEMQSPERAEQFRRRIDKLFPVVIRQNGQDIVCWFSDHPDLRYLLEEQGSSLNSKLKRPASYELTTQKAEEIGLIRLMDGKIVIPVEGDEHISYIAASLAYDNTTQSMEWIGFRSGPLVTFSKRYKASPYKADTMAALFGQVRFTPLFVTETDGHFGFVKFEKRSGQARIKELTDADNGKGTLGDAASFTYSNRLDEFITIRLVTDKAPLILWYDRNEALEKLLNTQPSSDVKRTELYYCEEGKVNIDVHPNPTDRELGITITLSNDEVISADLYDLTGKHCMSIPAGSDRETNGSVHFNAIIDHLREGIYIVTIRTAKGKCYSRKVIKYGL